MKTYILVITLVFILTGIYQIEFIGIDTQEELDRKLLQIYISFSTMCIIVALGGK